MIKTDYNPDVLTCLANLSNDEVFTPPRLVNEMLDLLPKELWSDKNVTFLDPVSKTGVFLREIAKRLMEGLENEIPDVQERVNHIYKNQLYGVAITELTSLLSRRSLYCSKRANGKYSVCEEFEDEKGNILYDRVNHTWVRGSCSFCGANKEMYERNRELETHAYQFIHTAKPERIFNNMRFDVIVGNPPYQLNDGGGMGTSAKPIYQKFIEQAKKLNPRYLTMIVPSRWFAGGKGLDEFRNNMLTDQRLSKIVDFFDSTECFPGVDISGGVCYFLWEKDRIGECEITNVQKQVKNTMERPLLESDSDSFIRFNSAVPIVRKIREKNESKFYDQISPRRPFGIADTVKPQQKSSENTIKMYAYPKSGYVSKSKITRNQKWVDSPKVYIAKAYGERGSFPYLVTAKPFIGEVNSCCSETYLCIGPYKSEEEAGNVKSYMETRFFRFLVLLKKNTQNAARGVYSFVPNQDFSKKWTDEELNVKYGLTQHEVSFIESMVRPMGSSNGK